MGPEVFTVFTGALILVGGITFLSVITYFVPIGLYIAAIFSGVRVPLFSIIGMRMRKVNPHTIIPALISATKAGLELTVDELETHFLAGGDVVNVVNALISAEKAGLNLTFQRATAIDLAGRHVMEAVRMCVTPEIIETPKVSAIAKDGIELIVVARVTLRADIDRLVGGAGEATILARIGEGIVTTIGSSASHKDVLRSPDSISRTVLAKGLDQGTAFHILSIDIADVDVGRNVGAILQTDQAEADKRIAQAKAEERRAMAVAHEQEMKAKIVEMQRRVVEAEAEVPIAMAEAFRKGRLHANGGSAPATGVNLR